MLSRSTFRAAATLIALGSISLAAVAAVADDAQEKPRIVQEFIEANCLDCHVGDYAEAGLDLESLGFDLSQRDVFDRWVLIHDRIRDGEMPPPDDGVPEPVAAIGWSVHAAQQSVPRSEGEGEVTETEAALVKLAGSLIEADRRRIDSDGRAMVRRLNRLEYENTLRAVLDAPWLQVADMLPEDGVDHLFNKIGQRLDVSHVQMSRYLETAEHAVRLGILAAAHPTETRKFYAREEPVMHNYLRYRFGQTAATRSIVPLVGTTPEPDVIRGTQPLTVGDSDPEKREQEAMGVFSGTYNATTKYDFSRVDAPTDGLYRLRFKTYTFMAGPNGASGGNDHGLTGGKRKWWRPDRSVAMPGTRSEPVTLYALAPSGDSRWLTTFDSHPEPSVFEGVVALRKGDGIRPDASRLVRTRPGWDGNPNATKEGVPGFAMNWLEVEGPLHDTWPPASYRAVFGELPFELTEGGQVKAIPGDAQKDAHRLLTDFYNRAVADAGAPGRSPAPFLEIYTAATELGQDFTEAMITSVSAILCAPQFLYLDSHPGPLSDTAFQQRLAYFLWNGPAGDPVRRLRNPARLEDSTAASEAAAGVREVVERMLDDERSERFVAAFLDYWLDLRDINANTPDAALYPDYYLDEMLTESSVLETRRFFRELLDDDLPARNLVDSDFAFVNERLAEHYDLPTFESVHLRRAALPEDSPRGGLLTQASVLRVTANGTTTSPVIRGAWVVERILGVEIPPPPSGVAAVEPDIRGATTIREQLEKHRAIDSCNACHAKFDPAGFALESFDIAGGWRTRYRAVGDEGERVEGYGKNGHEFAFRLAQPVDCGGALASGESFGDVQELKQILAADERRIARNLLHQLIVYATGAPVSFADRAEVEAMLDRTEESQYGVRSLIHAIVQSELFENK